jgi:hypothetical protein
MKKELSLKSFKKKMKKGVNKDEINIDIKYKSNYSKTVTNDKRKQLNKKDNLNEIYITQSVHDFNDNSFFILSIFSILFSISLIYSGLLTIFSSTLFDSF